MSEGMFDNMENPSLSSEEEEVSDLKPIPQIEPERTVTPVRPETEPENIIKLMEDGVIDKKQADKMVLDYQLTGNLYDMDQQAVIEGVEAGKITIQQAERYVERRENPVWWHAKDVSTGVGRGVVKGIEEMANTAMWLWNLGPHPAGMTLDEKADLGSSYIPESEFIVGQVAGGFAQFATAFIPGTKLVKAAKFGQKLLSSQFLAGSVLKHPKLAGFVERVSRGAAAGAIADFASFDPFEGRVTDFFEELGILPEYMDFMTTNPDNPEGLERFKNVVEGLGLGIALDMTVMFGGKVLRSVSHMKAKGKMDRVAEAAMQNEKTARAYESAQAGKIDSPSSSRLDDRPATDSKAGPDMGSPAKQELAAEKTFKNLVAGDDFVPGHDDNFIKKMEGFDDAQSVLRAAADSVPKRKAQSWKATDVKANREIKKLAEHTGGSVDGIVNNMRNMYGDIKGATEKARAMYRIVTEHSEQLGKMVREWRQSGGDHQEIARLMEHVKLNQEMQAMCYGVRTEFGRGLNMHKQNHRGSRWDYSELAEGQDLPEYIMKNKEEAERFLKNYDNMATNKDRLKFSRMLGKETWGRHFLAFVQANLLWSPATHMVNITSQAAALLFKGVSRTMAHLLVVGKQSPEQLRVGTVEFLGLGEALKLSFGGPFPFSKKGRAVLDKSLKENTTTVMKDGKKVTRPLTFRERVKKNPEIGTFWRSLIAREGIIDPSLKVGADVITTTHAFKNSWMGGLGSMINTIHKLPFHLLAGVDEVFKTMGTQARYNGLIMEEGIRNGKIGADLDAYYAREKPKMKAEYVNEALKWGKEITYQDDLGKFAGGIDKAVSSNNWGLAAKALFAPYFKTAVNLVKYATKNTALGLLSRNVRDTLMKGDVDAFEMGIKMSFGTAAVSWAYQKYGEGKIVGRIPADERDIARTAKVGDYSAYNDKTKEWKSYRRGDPFGLWIGAACDLHLAADILAQYQTDENLETELEDVMAAFIMVFTEPVVNSTWMKGMQDATKWVFDPERSAHSAKKVALQKAASFIPVTTGIDWINSEFGSDDVYREIHELVDIFKKKVSRLSKTMIPHRDPVYGRIQKRERRWGHLINKKTMTEDPVILEMLRVKANIKTPREFLMFAGVKQDLSPKQLNEFEEIYSKLPVEEALNFLIESPKYKQLGSIKRREELRKQVSIFRTAAKGIFLSKNKEVTQELIDKAVKQGKIDAGIIATKDSSSFLYNWNKNFGKQ
jgi:hypothetical protein